MSPVAPCCAQNSSDAAALPSTDARIFTASLHFGAEFQTQSEARIQLSRTNEYFPGTSERIMMISGTVNQVLTALHLVLAKMNSEKTVQDTMLARCGAASSRSAHYAPRDYLDVVDTILF